MLKNLLLISLIALIVLDCKKEAVIGKGFVLDAPVTLYKKPDKGAKPLATVNVLEEVGLLRQQVPDKQNPKLFWFKVRSGTAEGFISYDEAVLKSNFVAIMPVAAGEKALATADLKLRERPSQKAKAIAVLKKGTVVDIIGNGSLRVIIDAITDNWIAVNTATGQTGYLFAGYVKRGQAQDFDSPEKIAAALQAAEKGFAVIQVHKPKLIAATNESGYCEKNSLPELEKGSIVEIHGKKTDGGQTYYNIRDHEDQVNFCAWGYDAWINAKDMEYISDLYGYTKALNTAVEPQILDFVNGIFKNQLDARSVKVKSVKLRKDTQGTEYLEIEAKEGVSSTRGRVPNKPQVIYASRSGGALSLIGKFDNATLTDIDGDGNMELATDISLRESSPLQVYTLTPTGFKLVLGLAGMGESTIEPPFVVVKGYGPDAIVNGETKVLDSKYAGQYYHMFRLSNGKFTEVALNAKYKKLDDESRTSATGNGQ